MHSRLFAFFLRRLWPKSGFCPSCRAKVEVPTPLRERAWETVAGCRCGWMGSALSLRRKIDLKESQVIASSPDPPQDSGITHTDDTMEETWTLPKSGKSGCLIPFGILWLMMSSLASLMVWGGGTPPGLLMTMVFRGVFGILFPLIGVGLFYAGLRTKYARHRLSLSAELLTLEREMFGRRRAKSLRRSGITGVELKEFYSKNYQPVHGIEIRGRDGKLRFGSALRDDEKAWLAHDLKRALGLAMPADFSIEARATQELSAVEVEDLGHTVEWRFPPTSQAGMWGTGLALMFFSAFFITIVALNFPLPPPDAGFMRHAVRLFMIPFYAGPGILFLIGLVVFREGRNLARTSSVLRADAAGLSLDKFSRREQSHDEWRRDEVQRVQVASWIRMNTIPVSHAEVVTMDRAVRFGAGCQPEKLKAVCDRVRTILHLKKANEQDQH